MWIGKVDAQRNLIGQALVLSYFLTMVVGQCLTQQSLLVTCEKSELSEKAWGAVMSRIQVRSY
jgi:hypothetical protein